MDATRLWGDVAAFERALEEARHAEALEFYRGDLMQGFFLSGVPEFERWVEEERDQLRRRAAAAGWALAEAHEAGGDPVGASAWARHAQALGGGDEVAARRGDRAEAERISKWLAEFEGHYQRGGSTYYRARIAALLGEREEALDLLRRTHSEGHLDFWEIIHTEPDLDSLRDYPPFHELIRPKG